MKKITDLIFTFFAIIVLLVTAITPVVLWDSWDDTIRAQGNNVLLHQIFRVIFTIFFVWLEIMTIVYVILGTESNDYNHLIGGDKNDTDR